MGFISRVLNGFWALALLAGIIVLVLWATGSPTSEIPTLPTVNPRKPAVAAKPGVPKSGTPAPAAPQLKPAMAKVADALNLAILAREVWRLTGDAAGEGKAEVAAAQAWVRFNQVFGTSEGSPPAHLELRDELLAVDNDDLSRLPGPQAGARAQRLFGTIAGRTLFKIRVRRGGVPTDVWIYFGEETGLSKVPVAMPARVKIPHELAQVVQKEVWARHEYYQGSLLTLEERETLKRIIGASECTPEEYVWLTKNVLGGGFVGSVGKEQDWFKNRIAELGKAIPSMPVKDVVLTTDGRRIVGRMSASPDGSATVETALFPVTVRKGDIREIRSAADVQAEFPLRATAAENDTGSFAQSISWARENGLHGHIEYMAYRRLSRDPSEAAAREIAGYVKGADGRWQLGAGAGQVPGGVAAAADIQNRAVLRPLLDGLGYVEMAGKWHERERWDVLIPNLHFSGDLAADQARVMGLHSGELKWTLNRVALRADIPGRTALGAFTDTKEQEIRGEKRERYFAPTGSQGSVVVAAEAPGLLVECHVCVPGQVKERERQGSIRVMLTPEGGSPVELYSIAESEDRDFHNVTEHVKGKRRFTITVQMQTTPDKFHDYARLMSCLPESRLAFGIRSFTLRPAPEVDGLWKRAK